MARLLPILRCRQIPPGATQALNFGADSNIATGILNTIVGMNGPVVGAAHVRNSVTGLVGVYQAVECSQASDTLFGPYAGGMPTASSALYLLNGSGAAAALQPVFVSLAGTAVYTPPLLNLASGAVAVISDDTLPAGVTLPPDVYTIELATASPGIAGVLATTVGDVTTFADALAHALPVMAAMEPAGTPYRGAAPALCAGEFRRHCVLDQLLLNNTAAASNVLNMSFYKPDGSQGGSPMVDQLPAAGSKVYAFRSFFSLAPGLYSMVIGSSNSMVLQAEVAADDPATATYGADSFVVQPSSTRLLLPGIVYNGDVFTIVAAQNLAPAPADVSVDLLGAQGNIVATVQQLIMPARQCRWTCVRWLGCRRTLPALP